jgi:hypothetical protein
MLWLNHFHGNIDRNHYQAIFTARCGQNVLVCYDGSPKNGKTQLDEHEETCPKCKEYTETGTFPPDLNVTRDWYNRYQKNSRFSFKTKK